MVLGDAKTGGYAGSEEEVHHPHSHSRNPFTELSLYMSMITKRILTNEFSLLYVGEPLDVAQSAALRTLASVQG